jgi:anti-sigma B factor antagonist
MRLVEERVDNAVVLRIKGKFPYTEGPDFQQAISRVLERGEKNIVLDVGETSHVDSGSIGELVSAYYTASKAGARLVLANPTLKIDNILTMTQLITVFDVYQDVHQAVEALR